MAGKIKQLALLALLGLLSNENVNAKHHHHHHKHHKKHSQHQSLAQAEPAPVTPASNRKAFEAARDSASKTVATQQQFESTKTADVAARNAANTKATFDLKASVRNARQDQIQGEVGHSQWVTRSDFSNWAQVSNKEEPAKAEKADAPKAEKAPAAEEKKAPAEAKAPAAEAAADEAKAKAEKTADAKAVTPDPKAPAKVKKGNPQNSYDEKAASLKEVLETTKAQRAFEAKSNADVATAQAKYADSAENIKNAVRINRRIQANGGLNHDEKELYLGGKRSYEIAQVRADPAPEKAKTDAKDEPKIQNPENAYKEKADSLREVLETTKAQRAFEAKSNADVAAAQDKYFKQTEDQKNAVRVARRIQANGGLDQRGSFGKFSSSLAQNQTPDESRKSFEAQVKEAAATVATQQSFEATKTADVAKRNNANVSDTFNEKARVRAGRVAMMRGGPAPRYGGGHRKAETSKKAESLAQAQSGSSSSDSDSEEEDAQIMAQKKKQAIAQRQAMRNQAQAAREGSDSSSSSDSDSD